MTLLWEGTPVFAVGQYISAAGQLNALGKGAQLLFDRVTGYGAPFTGAHNGETYGALEWRLRHKWNRFDWEYYLASGTAYLSVNGVKLNGTQKTGPGWFSGTEDITALGLTANAFYPVTVTATGSIQVYRVAEKSTLVFPTLATFENNTAPLTAQWNDLATYTDYLHQETAAPRAPFGGAWHPNAGKAWVGCIVKTGNRWPYQLSLQTPYHMTGGQRRMKALLRAWHATTGEKLLGSWELTEANSGPAETRLFAGTLDVSAHNFPHGAVLRLWFDVERSSPSDFYGGAAFEWLYQLADDAPTLSGWWPLPTWAHPQYLADVWKLRDDLVRLKSAYQPLNFPARVGRPAAPTTSGPYDRVYRARRVHRWLHYVCAPKDAEHPNETTMQPQLLWNIPSIGLKTVSLEPTTTWGVFDLAGQESLYPGTHYALKDVSYALEDYDA